MKELPPPHREKISHKISVSLPVGRRDILHGTTGARAANQIYRGSPYGVGESGTDFSANPHFYAQSDGLMYWLTKPEIKPCMSLALLLCKNHDCSHKDCSRK